MADEIKKNKKANYEDGSIRHLEDLDHIRLRPGMYIGKLGDGSHQDDGIYVLLKESVDNSIDEFRGGYGKNIDITIEGRKVSVRDFGRGMPLNDMLLAVSKLNSSGKFDTDNYTMSVGLNGVGLKAVNALSIHFSVQAFREGQTRRLEFSQGKLLSDTSIISHTNKTEHGTLIEFEPDAGERLFENYAFRTEYVETLLRNYSYLNVGLTINYNGKKFASKDGLLDLLKENMTIDPLYPIIHLSGKNIEIVLTHTDQNNDEYHSFVNGQHTILGGTHQAAYKEAIGRTIKEFFNKNMELPDVRNGLVGAIAINVVGPVFESQTKVKLGSTYMNSDTRELTINKFVNDFVKQELDNFLHKHPEITEVMLQKIQDSEKERKAILGVTKIAREKAKKTSINNPKLRDCRYHLNDAKPVRPSKDSEIDLRYESSIFITEGLSASGSITTSRDVNTQAVFSLRGKPLNTFGKEKKVVYENEEFFCLQSALNIEDGIDNLRYNKVIIATDADVDGMHIRLLMLTFFLQFFPDLIKKGHVYILQTPLFRVIGKKEKRYCYSEEEKLQDIEDLKPNPKITRFKGLGEISPNEFKEFIGKDIRLDQVTLRKEDAVSDLLAFYMGQNTADRQNFIIDNLVVEEDKADE